MIHELARNATCGRRFAWAARVLMVTALIGHALLAAGAEDYAAFKRRALAPLEATYGKAIADHPQDPALSQFQDRLRQIDAAAEALLARLRALEASSLDSMLDAQTPLPGPAQRVKSTASASETYLEYAADFSATLPRPSLSDEAMKFLLNYYAASFNASRDYIARRCRPLLAANPKLSREVLQLAAVLPWLQVSDETWAPADLAALPPWMQEASALEILEDFALSIRRPLTAYVLANQRKPAAERSPRQLGLPVYLRDAAERLLQNREYHAALYCLKTAVDLAEKENRPGEVAWLRFRRAELLATVGYANLAAAEVLLLIEKHPQADSYSRATLLRLKYLYESDQVPAVLDESAKYAADARVTPHLAEVLYIRWLALRRVNHLEAAKKLQAEFLERFPRHPLGADMVFASAMASLSASDYPETLRLLDLIEYRYPDSRLVPKVKELQQRLQGSSPASHPQP